MFDGTYVTAMAIDEDGNSSELSQVRRPIVFVPDIGGTWLKDRTGANVWPPFELISDSDEAVMERLLRLEMNDRGEDIHGVRPHRVIETFLDKDFGNRGILQTSVRRPDSSAISIIPGPSRAGQVALSVRLAEEPLRDGRLTQEIH